MTDDTRQTDREDASTTTEEPLDDAETARTSRDVLPAASRRQFVKTAAVGTVAAGIGAPTLTGQGAAVTTATIKPGDGFADVAPWLENENPTIHRVTQATRSAVEAAFTASGPRVVVFETSGTIDLGGSTLEITNDKCWVAGQTAPSPGITFIKGTVKVAANDCVVQHIRSRVGPGPNGNIQGNDSFNTADGTSNNVADHVTASWGVDECMSVGYDTDRTTYSNCLIYEGLHDPYGDGSDHNYCTLVGDNATNVALLGNVWAKARSRIPRLKGGTTSVVANNFTYFFDEACNTDSSAETSWVGNVYAGTTVTGEPIVEGSGTVYSQDNVTEPPLDSGVSFVGPSTVGYRPLWPSGFSAMGSGQVESTALSNAGARPADRTGNDARIIQEIRDRAGASYHDSPYDYWIADHNEVGGYPQLPENTHSLSVPSSGLRDWLAEWSSVVETGSGNPGGSGGTGGSGGGSGGGTSGPIVEGTYRVTNVNSGKFLEVANANTSDGANVQQYADTGHPCQEWTVSDNGDGTYTFTNAHSGKLLEVANANTSDGANVRQWGDTGHPCQDWSVVDNGDGTYRLEAAHSGKVADVYEASTSNGANVVQWPWNGGAWQRWTFQQV